MGAKDDQKPKHPEGPAPQRKKLAYQPPQVFDHGSVTKLTCGGGSVLVDDGKSTMGML